MVKQENPYSKVRLVEIVTRKKYGKNQLWFVRYNFVTYHPVKYFNPSNSVGYTQINIKPF